MTVNCGGSEKASACWRMIRCAMAWKVPPATRAADVAPGGGMILDSISSAARRVDVSSRIRAGSGPCGRSQLARATRVLVLPVPAPASTSSGPAGQVAAWRCSSSSWSRTADSNTTTNVSAVADSVSEARRALPEPVSAGPYLANAACRAEHDGSPGERIVIAYVAGEHDVGHADRLGCGVNGAEHRDQSGKELASHLTAPHPEPVQADLVA